ncbi:hypothetical protein D1B17_06925 [Companilactobacillus zhachilii]|uniref:Uncharacterized protein n=1 Tax=Companilactobacillus zhachilii TaxID=2304606 RepID=A0A386PSF7_9LACO|nr:DUF5677 domain-containing protein [Companilactobacillus zhachilii]AYE38382.1 hypothetical protein D1B17_06925 [Companilactobacillus zhachilii]
MLENEKISEYKNSVIDLISKKGENSTTTMLDLSVFTLYTEMCDKAMDIMLLAKEKRYSSIPILARSFLEQAASLKFLLKEDQERRGSAYMYGARYKDIRNIQNLHDDFSDRKKADLFLKKIRDDFSKEGYDSYDDWTTDMQNKYFELFVEKARPRKWFNINGDCSSILDLFDKVGMLDEYRTYYNLYSAVTHGSDIMQNLSIKVGQVEINYRYDDEKTTQLLNKYLLELQQICFKYYQK